MTEHPSYLALDRAHLGSASADVAAHLSGCARCQAYLESLQAEPPPANLRARAERAQRSKAVRWLTVAAPVLALAAGVWLLARPALGPSEEPAPYIGVKGAEAAWLYIKRGEDTRLWDGKQPVRSGDRLRLKVDPGGYRYVQVFSLTDPEHVVTLYAERVTANGSFLLPEAWELDDSQHDERLLVVFSKEPAPNAWKELGNGKRRAGLASVSFDLPRAPR